jgi:hyperosmotically inducible periplasmic protein
MNVKSRTLAYVGALVVVFATAAVAAPGQAAKQTKEDAKQTAAKAGNAITDGWITMKVHAQFIPEDSLDGSDINVDTRNGVVSLTGTVPTPAGKERAVAIAKATDGVKSVNDNLRVAPTEASKSGAEAGRTAGTAGREVGRETKDTARSVTHPVTDGWIKSKIYAQFIGDEALEHSDINVDVSKGVVVLRGAVPSAAAASHAESIAKGTDGVKSVSNNLKIAPKK